MAYRVLVDGVVTTDHNGKPFYSFSEYLRANGALEKFVKNVDMNFSPLGPEYFRYSAASAINHGFYWEDTEEGDTYWEKLYSNAHNDLLHDLIWLLDVSKEEALKDPRITGKPIGMLDAMYSQIPVRIKL